MQHRQRTEPGVEIGPLTIRLALASALLPCGRQAVRASTATGAPARRAIARVLIRNLKHIGFSHERV
jgi:hypothetical protein